MKIRLHGSRKKGTLVEPDIVASNGIIHLVDKLMDAVPSTVISEKEVCKDGKLCYLNATDITCKLVAKKCCFC